MAGALREAPSLRDPTVVLGENAPGDGECRVGGRRPAVDRAVQDDLFDLILHQAVAKRRADVQLELLEPAQGHQRHQRYATARPAVQPRAGPDLTPGVARAEALEVGGEARRALECGIHEVVAQHLPPYPHPTLVERVVRCHLPCLTTGARCSRIARVTTSGRSMFAR